VNYAEALKVYAALLEKLQYDQLGHNYGEVMRRAWGHFLKEGDLKDGARPGAPHVIPVELALECSEALKAGRQIVKHHKGTAYTLVTYFTQVREAIALVPLLKETMDKYDVDAHDLYLAMKRADPYLTRRAIFLKPAFTDAQLADRADWCGRLVAEWQLPLAELRGILARFVQCDEGRWTYTVKTRGSKKVFIDKRTNLAHDYVTLPKINGDVEATVHWFMCVSPHPKFKHLNGLVYWEWTTGTTNIRRRHNTDASISTTGSRMFTCRLMIRITLAKPARMTLLRGIWRATGCVAVCRSILCGCITKTWVHPILCRQLLNMHRYKKVLFLQPATGRMAIRTWLHCVLLLSMLKKHRLMHLGTCWCKATATHRKDVRLIVSLAPLATRVP
jgi:hypothetical protein